MEDGIRTHDLKVPINQILNPISLCGVCKCVCQDWWKISYTSHKNPYSLSRHSSLKYNSCHHYKLVDFNISIKENLASIENKLLAGFCCTQSRCLCIVIYRGTKWTNCVKMRRFLTNWYWILVTNWDFGCYGQFAKNTLIFSVKRWPKVTNAKSFRRN